MDNLSSINADALRSIFASVIKKPKEQNLPSNEALVKLSKIMVQKRTNINTYVNINSSDYNRIKSVHSDLEKMRDFISSHLGRRHEQSIQYWAEFLLEYSLISSRLDLEDLSLKLEIFSDALSKGISGFEKIEPQATQKKTPTSKLWHEYVFLLADGFWEAMRSTNPNIEITLHMDGPAARFLKEAIYLVSGEVAEVAAIARYVKSGIKRRAAGP